MSKQRSFGPPVRCEALLTQEQIRFLDREAAKRAASRGQVVRDLVREAMEREAQRAKAVPQ